MQTYPQLIDQIRDMMEEWKEERDQLLLSAEQTQAYCQSLAFQVVLCASARAANALSVLMQMHAHR